MRFVEEEARGHCPCVRDGAGGGELDICTREPGTRPLRCWRRVKAASMGQGAGHRVLDHTAEGPLRLQVPVQRELAGAAQRRHRLGRARRLDGDDRGSRHLPARWGVGGWVEGRAHNPEGKVVSLRGLRHCEK